MSFGTDLSQEFHKLTKNVKFDEVCLFTKLQDAFINLKSSNSTYQYAIDIIHGHKSHVDFHFNNTWVSTTPSGKTVTRELADMMFVIYSHQKHQIRITYMQNKRGVSDSKFRADLYQLHLLSQRERITSAKLPDCLFGDRDILSNAILSSVGSYGVFYKYTKCVEMSYYPACLISPCNPVGQSVARMAKYDTSNYGAKHVINGHIECLGTPVLSNFGDSLISMQIGTPINSDMTAHRKLIKFLSKNVSGFMQGSLSKEYSDYIYDDNRDSWTPNIPVIYAINADRINDKQ